MYRKSNEELFEEAEQQLVFRAIKETEDEIANDAFDREPDDNDGDMSLERSEGWDGGWLSDDELWERTLEGDDDRYFDRPIEGRERDALAAENDQLYQALADRDARLDAIENGPERQAQLESDLRERLYQRYGVLGTTDEGTRALLSDMARQEVAAQRLSEDRINRSMADAHTEHGRDFEEAFAAVTRMDTSNPTARALIADVWNAPDPGARLMALHQNGIHGGLSSRGRGDTDMGALGLSGARNYGGGRSRGGGRSELREYNGGRDLPTYGDGFGNRSVEEEIFQSVWD